MERILMRLEVSKSETLSRINNLFRLKVQLDEQLKDNEVQIHFNRGIIEGLIQSQNIIEEIKKGEEIEAMMVEGDHQGEELPIEVSRQGKESSIGGSP